MPSESSDHTLGNFFNNLSYEYRLLLVSMLDVAEEALGDRNEPLTPPQRQRIEMIHRDGLRLLKLVNTPLDFSHIEYSDHALADGEPTGTTFTKELAWAFESAAEMSRLRRTLSVNRFKEEIFIEIARELQAPLTMILGWVRLLQTRSFDAVKAAQALATIEYYATIEAKLVQDLLDVYAILSGKLRLRSQIVDLGALVQSTVATFHEAAQAKHIQLLEPRPYERLENMIADGDRLKQVVSNLLDNAIKFTPMGGTVTIWLERIDSGVQITVSDTGVGIAPRSLPHIFDRFMQSEVSSFYTAKEIGIGLAIARHLVELHSGTIEAKSVEGSGATFTVKLPIIKCLN